MARKFILTLAFGILGSGLHAMEEWEILDNAQLAEKEQQSTSWENDGDEIFGVLNREASTQDKQQESLQEHSGNNLRQQPQNACGDGASLGTIAQSLQSQLRGSINEIEGMTLSEFVSALIGFGS